MDKKRVIPKSTICFVAGRSGGHIIPAFTLAEQEKIKDQTKRILLFTTSTKLDYEIIAQSSAIDQHYALALENLPYKNPLRWPLFAYQMLRATISSFLILRALRPDRIISMGGYISLPVCCAGKLLNIPIELRELNVEPGAAIKWLAPCAKTISICFEETKNYLKSPNCHVVPYPVRFTKKDSTFTSHQARIVLGISEHKKVLLILGGSQGSLFVNKLIHAWLEHLLSEERNNLYILHQVGATDDLNRYQAHYDQLGINGSLFTYRHDMAHLYAAADLIVCRAGAGTLFEVLFFDRPCITIPLETSSNSHQVANAASLAKSYPHLITMLRQSDVQSHFAKLVRTKLLETAQPNLSIELTK